MGRRGGSAAGRAWACAAAAAVAPPALRAATPPWHDAVPQLSTPAEGATYVRAYNNVPFADGEEKAVIVTSRSGGVFFFRASNMSHYASRFSPMVGSLTTNSAGHYDYKEYSSGYIALSGIPGAMIGGIFLGYFICIFFVVFFVEIFENVVLARWCRVKRKGEDASEATGPEASQLLAPKEYVYIRFHCLGPDKFIDKLSLKPYPSEELEPRDQYVTAGSDLDISSRTGTEWKVHSIKEYQKGEDTTILDLRNILFSRIKHPMLPASRTVPRFIGLNGAFERLCHRRLPASITDSVRYVCLMEWSRQIFRPRPWEIEFFADSQLRTSLQWDVKVNELDFDWRRSKDDDKRRIVLDPPNTVHAMRATGGGAPWAKWIVLVLFIVFFYYICQSPSFNHVFLAVFVFVGSGIIWNHLMDCLQHCFLPTAEPLRQSPFDKPTSSGGRIGSKEKTPPGSFADKKLVASAGRSQNTSISSSASTKSETVEEDILALTKYPVDALADEAGCCECELEWHKVKPRDKGEKPPQQDSSMKGRWRRLCCICNQCSSACVPTNTRAFCKAGQFSRFRLWKSLDSLEAVVLFVLITVCILWFIHCAVRDSAMHIAMEGQAKYANVFATVALCAGSEQVLPWQLSSWSLWVFSFMPWPLAWAPCPVVGGKFTPMLYIFDLDKVVPGVGGTAPTPQYAIPIEEWGAALHVQLVTIPTEDDPAEETLYAVVSSGFSQGFAALFGKFTGILGGKAQMIALPIAHRPTPARAAGSQQSTSFADIDDLAAERVPFTIDVTAALGHERQQRYTATLDDGPPMAYPEGVLIFRPPGTGHTLVMTAGVASDGMYVVDISGLPAGQLPNITLATKPAHSTGVETAWRQLVGRSYYAPDGKLYGATANFASPGGLSVFELSNIMPQRIGGITSEETEKANRVVLVCLGPGGQRQACTQTSTKTFAFVPLEEATRFALYDVTDPAKPCLSGLSNKMDVSRTYAMEVLSQESGDYQAILFGDAGELGVYNIGGPAGWTCQ